MKYVTSRIDWSKRADYIRERHFVEPAWADEAVADPEACWLAMTRAGMRRGTCLGVPPRLVAGWRGSLC